MSTITLAITISVVSIVMSIASFVLMWLTARRNR